MARELKTLSDIHSSVFEKAQLNSSASEASNIILRLINENYIDISQLHRWRWLQASSSTVVPKVYNTGAVTVSNASATVVGNASVSFTATMVGRKIHFDSESETYQILSRSSATRIILTEAYRGAAISSGAFSIYQDKYNLASDCEELLDVYYYPPSINRAKVLRPITNRQMINHRLTSRVVESRADSFTHGNITSTGTRTVEIWPPADSTNDYRIRYEYIKRITSLSAATQEPFMPITYRSSIMWGTLADIFMREGHTERMRWAEAKKNQKINEMRKDWETTDRRPRLRFAHNNTRRAVVSPARFDLGRAFDTDTWEE